MTELVDRARPHARPLQRLPRDLENQTLLRVHLDRLTRRDAEERRVELLDIRDEPAFASIGLAYRVGVGVVQGLRVPARRERFDRIAPLIQKRPVALRVDHTARSAARHRHNGHRLVARRCAQHRRSTRDVELRERTAVQQLRDRLRCRIVECQRRRKRRLRPRRKLVAKLHSHQRVQTKLLQRTVGRHTRGRGCQDRRHLLSNQSEHCIKPLLFGQRNQPLPKRQSLDCRRPHAP